MSLLDAASTTLLVGALLGIAHKAWPSVRGLVRLSDLLMGGPDRPGLLATLTAIHERLDRLEALTTEAAHDSAVAAYHSRPNHGGSSHDALMAKFAALEARLNQKDTA